MGHSRCGLVCLTPSQHPEILSGPFVRRRGTIEAGVSKRRPAGRTAQPSPAFARTWKQGRLGRSHISGERNSIARCPKQQSGRWIPNCAVLGSRRGLANKPGQAPGGCDRPALAGSEPVGSTNGHAEAQILATAEQIRLWHFAEWWTRQGAKTRGAGRCGRCSRRQCDITQQVQTKLCLGCGPGKTGSLLVGLRSGKGNPFGDACGFRTLWSYNLTPRDARHRSAQARLVQPLPSFSLLSVSPAAASFSVLSADRAETPCVITTFPVSRLNLVFEKTQSIKPYQGANTMSIPLLPPDR